MLYFIEFGAWLSPSWNFVKIYRQQKEQINTGKNFLKEKYSTKQQRTWTIFYLYKDIEASCNEPKSIIFLKNLCRS